MKTRHTEQAAEILLTIPSMATEQASHAIQQTLASMGHALRRFNSEDEEVHTFEEVFPDARPGLILRGFRAMENMTQASLAEKLGIHQNRVSEMESGKRPISVKTARKLGVIFGTSYKSFL